MYIKGVNLGNCLVLEKWMSPALFEGTTAEDEYYLPRQLSKEVYESARVDGANGLQTFFRITVPMMASNILFVSILATMNSFKVFDQINVLTEGGPGYSTNVLVYCIYHYAFREHNIGYASAVAVLLFLIIVIISAVQVKLKEKYTI